MTDIADGQIIQLPGGPEKLSRPGFSVKLGKDKDEQRELSRSFKVTSSSMV